MKKNLLLISLVCFFAYSLNAQIIHVPADQPTIQAGIDAAVDGDTVLVADSDSTYLENINFNGKAITVASHFIIDGDTNHINNTVIDGNQPANPDYGSVVTLNNDEDTTSVLCGFTITGGTGLLVEEFDMKLGGGIACNSAGIKILHNKIIDNEINFTGYAGGGGIGCVSEDEDNWLVARNNLISGNNCHASVIESLGGGVFSGNNLIFEDNEVCENSCTGINNAQANGGGILIGSQSRSLVFNIHNNFIHDNNCEGYIVSGAGVMVWVSEGTISGNEIWNNTGIAVNIALGGGMYIESLQGITNIFGNDFFANSLEGYHVQGGGIQIGLANDKVNIYNNSFVQNMLTGSNLAHGGGIEIIQNHEVSINNNLFQGNVMQGGVFTGAGISGADALSKTEIRNNTFSSNTGSGTGYGGGIAFSNANNVRLEIDGNIFENNSVSGGGGLYTYNCYNMLLSNNVFAGNIASESGGGCRLRHYAKGAGGVIFIRDRENTGNHVINLNATKTLHHPLLINNTFLNNTSPKGGAIYCDHQDEFPLIVNSVFMGNAADYGDNIYYTGEDSLLVSYCNINDSTNTHIYGKWKGNNNFYEDPGFIDDSCHIDSSSPCFGAGTDSLEFMGIWYHAPGHDYEGSPRPFYSGIDIGADEFDGVGIYEFPIQNSELKIQLFPNPTRGVINCRLSIVDCRLSVVDFRWVTLKVYDLHGREVAVMVDKKLPAGEHILQFDAYRLPDGIYFLRLQTNGISETRKLILLK